METKTDARHVSLRLEGGMRRNDGHLSLAAVLSTVQYSGEATQNCDASINTHCPTSSLDGGSRSGKDPRSRLGSGKLGAGCRCCCTYSVPFCFSRFWAGSGAVVQPV